MLFDLMIDVERSMVTRKEFCAGMAVTAVSVFAPNDGFSAVVDSKKRALGQFYTHKNCWLHPHIKDFISSCGCCVVYDPFAGIGCLIKTVKDEVPSITESKGLDIDRSLGWDFNDSLINIPHVPNAIIVTNPPYISNYSARRKKINVELDKYFDSTCYDDVYLLALDKMLEAQRHVVAIVPETFINSSYKQKDKLTSITILEENPFNDTDAPVVVLCFDSVCKPLQKIKVYKNAQYVCSLGEVENSRLVPKNSVKMKFNDPSGWLAVRCVDNTSPDDRLRFAFKSDINYNWEERIKVSSRLLTLIALDVPDEQRFAFILECNRVLEEIRRKSHDIILSPFKGNARNGIRRRRLDFLTCRAIIERAYHQVVKAEQLFQPEFF